MIFQDLILFFYLLSQQIGMTLKFGILKNDFGDLYFCLYFRALL